VLYKFLITLHEVVHVYQCDNVQDLHAALSTVSSVCDIIRAVADHMTKLVIYHTTEGSPVFGTVPEIMLVCHIQLFIH